MKLNSLFAKKLARMMKEELMVIKLFRETVKMYPNKVAVIFEDQKFTYKELDEVSNRIANMLRTSTALQRGDTVAMVMENCPEFVMVALALFKIGVTGAFINHNLRGDSLAHCIRIVNCSGAIFSAALSDAVAEVLPSLEISHQLLFAVGSGCSLPQAKSLEEEIENASPENPPPVQGEAITGGITAACIFGHT